MEKLVNFLFKFEPLRLAIFAEVNFYNSIKRTLNDPESMSVASAFWCEEDGWRGWGINYNGNYYFHDIPEKHLSDILDIVIKQEIVQ